MKEKLTHNLGLKILSAVIAIFMWLIMVNVSNPLETGTQEVQVEILNKEILEESGLTYELVGKNTVTVSYSVRVRDKNRISASDFKAYADLAELYDVTGAIPVKVDVVNREASALIEDGPTVRPGVVRVQTEKLQTKRFTLKAAAVGEQEDGYEVGEIALNPESVYVTGATSEVGQISSVGVEIRVDGANADLEGTATAKFYDANGNELSGMADKVELNVNEIHYTVPILKVKTLPVNFLVTGQAAEGYRFTGVESDVTSVSAAGLKSTLATINALDVPAELLDVTGAVSDVTVQVNLEELLPDGLVLAGEGGTVANVTLKVEKLQTWSLTYSMDDVVVTGEQDYRIYTFGRDDTELLIRGLEDDLDTLSTEDIYIELDVSDLQPGDYMADFVIALPEGFELIAQSPVALSVETEVGPGIPPEGTEAGADPEESSAGSGGTAAGTNSTQR